MRIPPVWLNVITASESLAFNLYSLDDFLFDHLLPRFQGVYNFQFNHDWLAQ